MKTYISIIIFILLLTSCNRNSDIKEMTFSQTQEEIGNIKLQLMGDKSFRLNIMIAPTAQLEIEGDSEGITGINQKFRGIWTINGENIRLIFKGDNVPISKIFNSNVDQKNTVKVLNVKEVSFNKNIKNIVIYGVDCKKKYADNKKFAQKWLNYFM